MKEVIETVSEVQFRSIAVIVAVALLGMMATWWFLTGPASPPLTAAQPESDPGSVSEIQAQEVQPQQNQTPEQPEIVVAQGNEASTAPSLLTETSHVQELEDAGNRFTVQIGAFQQEEGARRRLAELEEQGYEARLVSYQEQGASIFRVVAGDFRTRLEAALAVSDLKARGIDAFVRKYGTELH